jgi:hypothetical protein
MRRLFTILALLGMAVGFSAQGARADLTGPANLQFFDSNLGGLFSLTFPGVNNFDGEFFGPQMFSLNSTDTVATFLTGPFAITGGTGFPSPMGSFFFNVDTLAGGDITGGSVSGTEGPSGVTYTLTFTTDVPINSVLGSDPTLMFTVPLSAPFGNTAADSVVLSSVDVTSPVPTPEPSSLLLLGSGFLALSGFARKRLIAHFN